jgi:hypothetical protein
MGTTRRTPPVMTAAVVGARDTSVSATVSGFGTATAITLVFNTALAWVKDAWDPLNNFMAHLTGHHWITHGLTDVAVFLVLGLVLTARRGGRRGDGIRLAMVLVASGLVAGAGLGFWFLIT